MVQMISELGRKVIIERKNNRNMYLRIEPDGSLYITCPYHTSENEIRKFIVSKRAWILKAEKKNAERTDHTLTGENGQEAMLLGKKYPVEMKHSDSDSIVMENNRLVYFLRDFSPSYIRAVFYNRGNSVLAKLVQEKRTYLDESVCRAHHLPYPHITIRYTRSQWGSCTPAHHAISLSSRLIHYPSGCLEYVMTHEYSHLLVANHSEKFYKTVELYMPEWKKYSDILKGR